MKKRFIFLAVGAMALTAGCSRTDDHSAMATAVAEEMVEWLKGQETADVREVLEQIAQAEASQETEPDSQNETQEESSTLSAQQEEEAKRDYLLQLCQGTHLTPYGVETIDDTDGPLINTLFENAVVIGDSRVEGVEWVLDSSRVFFDRGAYAGNLLETAEQAAAMYPKKALSWIGLNDMSVYDAYVDRFVRDYQALVQDFLSINPGCEIYIHNQPQVPQAGIDHFPFAVHVDLYNEAMEQMCEENGWIYVDGSSYLKEENFASDGLHFDKRFYQFWIQDMANQLDLWEDLAQ